MSVNRHGYSRSLLLETEINMSHNSHDETSNRTAKAILPAIASPQPGPEVSPLPETMEQPCLETGHSSSKNHTKLSGWSGSASHYVSQKHQPLLRW